MPTGLLIGAGVGALAGGVSAFGKKDPVYSYHASPQEQLFQQQQQQAYQGYQSQLNGSDSAFGKGQSAYQDYGNALKAYASGGNVPSQSDITQGNQYAASQFGAQHEEMQQAFQDQLRNANRQAALSGRSLNDPILRAKLGQEQTRQEAVLNANQGAFASQWSMQQPGMRLGAMGTRAQALGQMGQNALQGQGNLYSMASQGLQGERGFNEAMAQGDFVTQQNHTSFGQRLGQTLTSGIAGAGAGMQAGNALNGNGYNMFGGGGNPGGGNMFGVSSFPGGAQAYNMFGSQGQSYSGNFGSQRPAGQYSLGANYGGDR